MAATTLLVIKVQALTEQQRQLVLNFIDQLPSPSRPQTHLYGLFKGIDTTEDEIAEARREMWGNFPREDF
jgi:hypothetical protein